MVGSLAMIASGMLPEAQVNLTLTLTLIAGHLPEAHLIEALSNQDQISTPRAPVDGVTLVGSCYCRKLQRSDSSAVWVGPREWGGVGMSQAYSGDKTELLDWRAMLHRAQAGRIHANQVGWGRDLVQQVRDIDVDTSDTLEVE